MTISHIRALPELARGCAADIEGLLVKGHDTPKENWEIILDALKKAQALHLEFAQNHVEECMSASYQLTRDLQDELVEEKRLRERMVDRCARSASMVRNSGDWTLKSIVLDILEGTVGGRSPEDVMVELAGEEMSADNKRMFEDMDETERRASKYDELTDALSSAQQGENDAIKRIGEKDLEIGRLRDALVIIEVCSLSFSDHDMRSLAREALKPADTGATNKGDNDGPS